MSLPDKLWRDEESVHEASFERRRLRIVLLSTDSTRTLLSLHEQYCQVVGLVTPWVFRPAGAPAVPRLRRVAHRLWNVFSPLPPLEALASELRVPVLRVWSITEGEVLRQLEALHPDLLVVAGYPEILPERVLSLPRLGCLNVHASLLPRYRGPQPIVQALLHGEPFTGVTIHFLDRSVDTGDIVAQDVVPILPEDTVYTLSARIFELGGRILVDCIERLALGTLQRRRQDARRATYFRRLGPDAGRIDWSAPGARIHNLLRLSPWLEVYTHLGRRRLVVLAGRLDADGAEQSVARGTGLPPRGYRPGQILWRDGRSLAVLCGDGKRILLRDWRLEGTHWGYNRAEQRLRAGTVLGAGRAGSGTGASERGAGGAGQGSGPGTRSEDRVLRAPEPGGTGQGGRPSRRGGWRPTWR